MKCFDTVSGFWSSQASRESVRETSRARIVSSHSPLLALSNSRNPLLCADMEDAIVHQGSIKAVNIKYHIHCLHVAITHGE